MVGPRLPPHPVVLPGVGVAVGVVRGQDVPVEVLKKQQKFTATVVANLDRWTKGIQHCFYIASAKT